MKRLFILFLFITLFLQAAFAINVKKDSMGRPLYAADRIKVKLSEDAAERLNLVLSEEGDYSNTGLDRLDNLFKSISVSRIDIAHRPVLDKVWEQENGFNRWYLLFVPIGTDIESTITDISSNEYIEHVNPEYIYYYSATPNDSYFDDCWGHDNTAQLPSYNSISEIHDGPAVGTVGFDSHIEEAWDDTQGYGDSSIIIAIIDSGVDYDHEDLDGNCVTGYDYADGDDFPMDELGHGTSCAGVAAAEVNNAIGVSGVAGGCSIMPLKISIGSGGPLFSAAANALTHCGDNNVDIASMSFSADVDYGDDPTMDAALQYAYDNGVTLLAATGNNNQSHIRNPANDPNVIAVGAASPCAERKDASSCDDEYWWGSNYGVDTMDARNAVDIVAPMILPATDITGVNGYSSGDYNMFFNGTSCATPYAAGVAALIKSKNSSLTPAQIRAILTSTATDVVDEEPTAGWDKYTGYGMVNADAAVGAVIATNTWDGLFNRYWSQQANWSLNHVPTAGENVVIPAVGYHDPMYVDISDAECNDLTIASGVEFQVKDQTLTVNGDLTVSGQINMLEDTATITVMGDVVWESGSYITTTMNATYINVYGDWDFSAGANVNPTQGYINFYGTTDSWIRSYSTSSSFYRLRNYKSGGAKAIFSNLCTEDIVINDLVYTTSSSILESRSSHDIIMRGNFNYYGTFDFTVLSNTGSVIFDGAVQNINNYSSGSGIFNNIVFSPSTSVTLFGESITVAGDLTIEQGNFNPANYDVTVGGDWTNTVGTAGFTEGTGRVIFDGGNYHQYCSNETFNELELNKVSGGAFRVNGTNVVCAAYDWTAGAVDVLSGSFTTNDLLDGGIYGAYYLNSGGTIDLNNSGSWVDLNGEIHIFGGTMTVVGSISEWSYSNNALIEMTDGVLDFTECGISVVDYGFTLTEDITGGAIRTVGNFIGTRSDFNPTGGTIELYGSTDASLSIGAGSNFYNILINKAVSDETTDKMIKPSKDEKRISYNRDGSVVELTRSEIVVAASELDINGDFILNTGIFDTNGNDMYVSGDWANHVGEVEFVEGTQKVVFDGPNSAAILTNETFYDLHLDKTYSGFAGLETGFGDNNGVDVTVINNLNLFDGTMELNNPTNLVIGNSVIISVGAALNANDSGTINISVLADWINFNDGGGFDAGTNSIVTFNGTTPASIHAVRENSYFNDIIIDSGSAYVRPTDTGPVIYCNNMDIVAGRLKVASYKVVVDEALSISGVLEMSSPDDSLYVGDITWESGSSGLVADGLINVSGNWTNSGGSFSPGISLVEFDSSGDPQDVFGTNTFYDVHQVNNYEYLRFNDDTTILNDLELHYYCWAYDNFQINGTLSIDDALSKFTASGSLANATIATLDQGGTVFCNGEATITINDLVESVITGTYYADDVGGVINLSNGGSAVDLEGNLYINGGTMNISGNFCYWPYTADASITMTDGVLDVTSCGIYLYGSNTLTETITGGTIRTAYGFTGTRTDFNPTGGTIELYGSTDASLSMGAGSNFYNVLINKAATDEILKTSEDEKRISYSRDGSIVELTRAETVNASSLLDINGDFIIDSGVFDTNGFDMYVAEDWANNVGDAGFIEGTQTVTFDGSYSSDITTDETFYNLTAANPAYTGWKVPQVMDNLTINVISNLNIDDGCMKVGSNSIINVGNDLTILNDAGLDMSSYYNQQLNISGDWMNDNTTYTTWIGFHPGNNSIVTFNGSTDQVVTTQAPQEDFANLVIDNSGGEFRSNDNIQVLGNLLLFDGEWNDNVPSLTHTFHGDFEVTSNAAWYTHINPNTVVFAGENDQEFIYNHIGAGYFKDVIIDKLPVDIAMNNGLDQHAINVNREVTESRAQTITMYTDMDLQIGGTLTIDEGTLEVNGNILRAYGDVTINSGGILSMNSNSTLWISDGSELSVNGGNLNAIGTPGNLVNFRHRSTGYYDFDVENGGTIAAEYAQFQHMGSNGVYVRETGLVDPAYAFNYCTFLNGTPGFAPLVVFNNDQTLTCTEVNFPQTGVSDINAAKAFGSGIITFVDAYGDFAGEAYEYDLNNQIEWTTGALSPIDDLTIQYNAGSNEIELNWTYPVPVDQFKIYRSTDPYDFSSATIFTTPTVGYSEPATGTKYFYQVTAENITDNVVSREKPISSNTAPWGK